MSKGIKIVIGLLAGLLLASTFFAGGVAFGSALPALTGERAPMLEALPDLFAPAGPAATRTPSPAPEDLQSLFAPFWQAWDIVHEQFVDQPLDDTKLMQGAIRGMLQALDDPHTAYMDPYEFEQANIPLEGEYEGIGAWVDPDAEYLTIVAPMPDSPAEKAGMLPGDEIVAVNGEDMTGVDGNLVIRKVMGPAGTEVRLTVRREGEPELLEFVITRASITIPSVEGEMLEEGIAYVRLYTFGERTTRDLRATLRDLLKEDPKGLILDLRGNGGGFLDTAVEVASQFIPKGSILVERFGDGTEQVYRAQRGGLATDIPLVVLIDGGSASASEIVAGAIQDLGRGLLVGETSFGKGSVQNWIPLSGNQGAVRVTIARWYTPNGRLIQQQGLEPDVAVEITEEDIKAGRDPQLEKAIELLLKKTG